MAFLEIDDVKPDEQAVRLFSGWMFASSPALSALAFIGWFLYTADFRVALNIAAAVLITPGVPTVAWRIDLTGVG